MAKNTETADEQQGTSSTPEGEETPPTPKGLRFTPYFATGARHPLDEVTYEQRHARIAEPDGTVVFEGTAEVPKEWSQLATDIVTSKYFRKAGLPGGGGETSVRQVVSRISESIADYGFKNGYFASKADTDTFERELTFLLVNQYGAFNSPVWFNGGLHHKYGIEGSGGLFRYNETTGQVDELSSSYKHFQASACFISEVKDDLMEIFEFVKTEARLFKYGSGSGAAFDYIRAKGESLSGGGTSSGLMSWLKVLDAGAGSIKSGGTCLAPYQRVYTEAGPVAVSDLAKREHFIAVSYDPPAGSYKAKRAMAWCVGSKRVVRVVTDKGSYDVTYDHPVKLSTGEYLHAEKLCAGQALFACAVDAQGRCYQETQRTTRVEDVGTMDVFDVEVDCPTADDKSPTTGHNFVVWPSDEKTGSGVVVANTRRAATMRTLSMDHPEVVDFIEWKAKEEKKAHALIAAGYPSDFNGEAYATVSGQNSNNSVRVSDEFMQAVENDGEWRTTYRTTGKVAQTYKARDLWKKIAQAAHTCVREGSRILTSAGWVRVEEAAKEDTTEVYDGFGLTKGRVWHVGRKALVRVVSSDGRVIDLTPDHQVYTSTGWTEAKDLQGCEIPCPRPEVNTGYRDRLSAVTGGSGRVYSTLSQPLAEALGFLHGDGSFDLSTGTTTVFFTPEKDADFVASTVVPILADIAANSGEVYEPTKNSEHSYRFCRKKLLSWLDRIGFPLAPVGERPVPEFLWQSPQSAQCAYLRGLFGANGSVIREGRYTRVTLTSTCKQQLEGVQLLLQALGIESRVQDHGSNPEHVWASGHTGDSPAYKVIVGARSAVLRFADLIGFPQESQVSKLCEIYERGRDNPKGSIFRSGVATIVSVIPLEGLHDVYDFTSPTTRAGVVNGLLVHNCADPGLQYDTTINDWHTVPNSGRIRSSNPCCFAGNMRVNTSEGWLTFEELERRSAAGEALPFAVGFDTARKDAASRPIVRAWVAGETTDLVEVCTLSGLKLLCTPEHRFLTQDGHYVEAQYLTNARIMPGTAEVFARGTELRTQGTPGCVPKGDPDAVLTVTRVMLTAPVKVYDIEVADIHNFGVAGAGTGGVDSAVVVSNSEFLHLDDTACNLASLNLVKYLVAGVDGALRFDVEAYRRAVRVFLVAQEILVGMGSYPTRPIAQKSYEYRPLGLGYANLGALLMLFGHGYDSDEGRAMGAALTAILTGHAYRVSAEMAEVHGPFAGFEKNREPMLRVMRKHAEAAAKITERHNGCLDYLYAAANEDWNLAVYHGTTHGYRNAQVSVCAPTGCLVAGTLVATSEGLLRIEQIGDEDGPQWQDIDLTVQTDEGPKQAAKFYVNGVDDVIEVRTAAGYRLRGTPKHQIKVVTSDGEWAWRRFDALQAGDRVPLAMHQHVGMPCRVDLPACPPPYRVNKTRGVRAPAHLDAEMAELVGIFAANGSLHDRGLRFAMFGVDTDAIERYAMFLRRAFGVEPKPRQDGEYTSLELHSTQVRRWWEAAGFAKIPSERGGKGFTARVPDAILHSNDPVIYGAYLRGLFTGDGTVNSGRPSLSNKDRGFVSDVQTMLLGLGVPMRLDLQRGGWSDADVWRLTCASSVFHEVFTKTVGFAASRKQALVREPGSWSKADFLLLSSAEVDRLVPPGSEHRKDVIRQLRAAGGIARHTALRIQEGCRDSKLGRALDFFYDEIEDAVLVGREPTFDLSVPSNVTYYANGFVSHNTIGLLMDCATTGIEPDFALVKFKKLAGGGSFKIINESVPEALRRLGYSESEVRNLLAYALGVLTLDGIATSPALAKALSALRAGLGADGVRVINAALPSAYSLDQVLRSYLKKEAAKHGLTAEAVSAKSFSPCVFLGVPAEQVRALEVYLLGHGTLEGSNLKPEHLAIFDCASQCGDGTRALSVQAHLLMMAATQPFFSGAISKTANMPESSTVEDIANTYFQGWKLGLKAVALYRDGCKASQPLSSKAGETSAATADLALPEARVLVEKLRVKHGEALFPAPQAPVRKRLPTRRVGFTQEAMVAGTKLFLRTGEFEDGRIGEIFIDMHKEGAAFRAMANNFAIAVSMGLQYGVPFEKFVEQFTFTRFEPYGQVIGDPHVKMATSILDYVFRTLGISYLGRTELASIQPTVYVGPITPKYNAGVAGVAAPEEAAPVIAPTEAPQLPEGAPGMFKIQRDALFCDQCGHVMVRSGTCMKCTSCGSTSGCS